MRRHVPGLCSLKTEPENNLNGLFLVRVNGAVHQWHRHKPYLDLRFVIVKPTLSARRSFSGRLYCTERALWKLNWFLHDFGYDTELLSRGQVDEKSLLNLLGVVRTSCSTVNRHSYQNLDAFAPAPEWEPLSSTSLIPAEGGRDANGL